MNRYRIILESEENLSDDKFLELMTRWFHKYSWSSDDNSKIVKFEVVEAINLEGIVESSNQITLFERVATQMLEQIKGLVKDKE